MGGRFLFRGRTTHETTSHPLFPTAMGFSQCMLDNEGDMGSCEYWFAAMKDCRLGERRAEMQ